jgi:hypothetical protein
VESSIELAHIKRYIVIDDQIECGNTLQTIQKALTPAIMIAIFLYESPRDTEYTGFSPPAMPGVPRAPGVPVFGLENKIALV